MHERRRLLITGATGFIGQHLVPALVERGHRVVAVVRHPVAFGPSIDQVLIKDLAECRLDAAASRYRRGDPPCRYCSPR